MKKIVILACLIFLCTSCFWYKTGYWIDGACRPKKPNFKILKTPFKETDKLVFNKVYIIDNGKYDGIGFYSDGRIIQWYPEDMNQAEKEITWSNSHNIGYWRVDGVNIEYEYFVCSESGYYLEKKGQIKGDTIVFYQNLYDYLLRKEVREERYILSDMGFD